MDEDLSLARQVLPEKQAIADWLEQINRRTWMELLDSRELLQNKVSFMRKLLMARKYFRGDGGFKKGTVWVLTYISPSVYLAYMQWRLHSIARKSEAYRDA
jgi:hypothetical protein